MGLGGQGRAMPPPRIVVITGPTATGKTALAIDLARRHDGEIVSADSRQVYRHLDIGTAKPTAEQQAQIRHHVIDVVDPDERFDAARFRGLAETAIADIVRRGKRVFVVGGTGLYIRALIHGLFVGPSADPALRCRLAQQEQEHGPGYLHTWLARVDAESARRLHPNDRMRLIRALEVWLRSGKPLSVWQHEHAFWEQRFPTLQLALVMERDRLAQRIEARCRQMFRAGLADELRRVWNLGFDADLSVLRTIGYTQAANLLHGRCPVEEAISQTAQATRRLAKRQLTWLRGESSLRWYTPAQTFALDAAVQAFFKEV